MNGLRRIEWPGEDGVTFHLGHGEWIDLLRAHGLEVERLIELLAPEDAVDHPYYDVVQAEWASKWPAEDVCVAPLR